MHVRIFIIKGVVSGIGITGRTHVNNTVELNDLIQHVEPSATHGKERSTEHALTYMNIHEI